VLSVRLKPKAAGAGASARGRFLQWVPELKESDVSQREEPATRESFERKLERLRLKIDLLPAEQRPYLVALADTIKQQHGRTSRHEHASDANG
jgi:hypothetical protein